jgi:hypothetical protein
VRQKEAGHAATARAALDGRLNGLGCHGGTWGDYAVRHTPKMNRPADLTVPDAEACATSTAGRMGAVAGADGPSDKPMTRRTGEPAAASAMRAA